MTDDTDELGEKATRQVSTPASLGWPLVERRRPDHTPYRGIERRASRAPFSEVGPTLSTAPLWPFRVAAWFAALIRAAPDLTLHNWNLYIVAFVLTVYTIDASWRPVPYRNDLRVRGRIVIEQGLTVIAVVLSGAWDSPFVLFLVPTGMLAGFAAGWMLSAEIAAVAVAVITVQHVPEVGVRQGLQDGALWAGLLALVAFTSGLAHKAAVDAARQQLAAQDRVSRLAEANSLLFALQRVAQTLPASLDFQEVLDSTVGRLRTMIELDALVVYLVDLEAGRADPVRSIGIDRPIPLALHSLPKGLGLALESPKTVRLDDLAPDEGVGPGSRSGLYTALHARGALIGLIAVESRALASFGQQQAEVVHGLSEPFGIAIDNARMFEGIREFAADEERSRIARDLHDHIGSSLALIGFEVDRAVSIANDSGEVAEALRDLRLHISAVVAEVRDTLYDLRTEVDDAHDLTTTTAAFLARVQQRSGIATHCDIRLSERPPALIERELWQIMREAIINAERHSQAAHLMIAARETTGALTFTVRDDGVGIDESLARHDSYGIVGMRERAKRINGDLTVSSLPTGGTEMRVVIRSGRDARQ